MDVKASGGVVYVASEGNLVTLTNIAVPPVIEKTAITVTGDGTSSATLSGGAGAITGVTPLSIAIAPAGGTAVSGISVDASGRFGPTTLAAAPGASLALTVTDGKGAQATRNVGPVPFTSAVDRFVLRRAISNDPNAKMRHIVASGTALYASYGYPWSASGTSDEIFGFDLTRALAAQTPSVLHAGQAVQAFTVANGWAYVAGATDFITVNLSTGQAHTITNGAGHPLAVAVSGKYAFVSIVDANWQTSTLQIFDVTNPAAAQLVRSIPPFGDGYAAIWGLDTSIPNKLIALEPSTSENGTVYITDISDINNITVASHVAVGEAINGFVAGNTLYVTGDGGGVAVVDITNLSAPAVLSLIPADGPSRSVAPVRPNLLAVAAGGGVMFVDVTDRANPQLKSIQLVGGTPLDVLVIGKTLYTAGELVLDGLKLP